MSQMMNLPYVSIVFDPATARKKQEKGEMVIYGDAMNEPILLKAHVDKAQVVVLSVGAMITAMAVIEKIRRLNPTAFILVRTKYVDDVEELYKIGANQVIPEEFETAIEIFRRVLEKFLVNHTTIDTTISKIRKDHYGIFREDSPSEKYSILNELPNIEIMAFDIQEGSSLIGKTLFDVQFRKNFGVSVVAIRRNEEIIEHPSFDTYFCSKDIVYLMGKPEQINNTIDLFRK